MKKMLMEFWKDETGMGTIEIIVIIAVLVAVALIFRDSIMGFVKDLIQKFFKTPDVDQSGGDAR